MPVAPLGRTKDTLGRRAFNGWASIHVVAVGVRRSAWYASDDIGDGKDWHRPA